MGTDRKITKLVNRNVKKNTTVRIFKETTAKVHKRRLKHDYKTEILREKQNIFAYQLKTTPLEPITCKRKSIMRNRIARDSAFFYIFENTRLKRVRVNDYRMI